MREPRNEYSSPAQATAVIPAFTCFVGVCEDLRDIACHRRASGCSASILAPCEQDWVDNRVCGAGSVGE